MIDYIGQHVTAMIGFALAISIGIVNAAVNRPELSLL
jgi:hypothetical protein